MKPVTVTLTLSDWKMVTDALLDKSEALTDKLVSVNASDRDWQEVVDLERVATTIISARIIEEQNNGRL